MTSEDELDKPRPNSFSSIKLPFSGEIGEIDLLKIVMPTHEELGVALGLPLSCVPVPFWLSREERSNWIDRMTRELHLDWGGRVHVHIIDIAGYEDFSDIQSEALISGVIIPEKKTAEGTLIKSYSLMWLTIVNVLKNDWTNAFQIPPHKWEEIMAGAFDRAGFDEVILTSRSRDFGRDVIAIKRGVGSIKIINSVKAYSPGNLVSYDDVRAAVGVLAGEIDASKAIVSTTSAFPPRIHEDPFISALMPTRLELLDGQRLQEWLSSLLK